MKKYRGHTIRKMPDGRYDIFDNLGLVDEKFKSIGCAMCAIDYMESN
jgi:hypothetical protein